MEELECTSEPVGESGEIMPALLTPKSSAGKSGIKKSGNKSTGKKMAEGTTSSGSNKAWKKKSREERKKKNHDDLIAAMEGLVLTVAPPPAPTGTGLVYDERMTKHHCPFGSEMGQSENPQRVTVCYERLKELNLVERCTPVPIRHATDDEVLTVHSQDYLAFMKSTPTMTLEELRQHYGDPDVETVFYSNDTYECASLALGGALELTEKVVKGELRNGVAVISPKKTWRKQVEEEFKRVGLKREDAQNQARWQDGVRAIASRVRPPGHHAQKGCGNGYCHFNNAAIAAQIARTKWNVERVLIVDWDVHHGQGIQYCFEEDPSVLYFSTHRYDRRGFWPNLSESNWDHIGKGDGQGYNINVPWNHRGHGNAEYLAAFQQVLLPIAYEFDPELIVVSTGIDSCLGDPKFDPWLIVVSCGIDAGLGDPEGEMSVHPGFYCHLTHMLMSLAQGKVVMLLEGGYNMKSLPEGLAMCTNALLGDPCPPFEDIGQPCDSAVETILEVISHHRPYWQCLTYQVPPKSPAEQCEEVSSSTGEEVLSAIASDMCESSQSASSEKTSAEASPPLPIAVASNLLEEYTEEETLVIGRKLDQLIAQTSLLKIAPHRTCIVYDERMQQHKPPYNHPERPQRIAHIFSRHKEWGLLERCLTVEARLATDEEITLCHNSEYLEETKDFAMFSPSELLNYQDRYSSIYLHQNEMENLRSFWKPSQKPLTHVFMPVDLIQSSIDCARMALGSTLNIVDTVLTGKAESGVAIVRPPGHHAECHTAMGFCFFNNVAIAARYAMEKYGLKRVLIVDWDIHHGNGTQHMFEDDKSVLYMSLHRYDGGFFFPGGEGGKANRVGLGEREGCNINIAWNRRSMGDAEYIAAFQQVIMPIAYEFNPELVLVSAGFDAAAGDHLGGYRITPEGYAHMTHMLRSLAQGKVLLVLEGGYNLNSISQSMAYCTRTLLGDPVPAIDLGMPCTSAVESILETLHQHKKYWKCLQYQVTVPTRDIVTSTSAKELPDQDLGQSEDMPRTNILVSNVVETPKSGGTDSKMAKHTGSDVAVSDFSATLGRSAGEGDNGAIGQSAGSGDPSTELEAAGGSNAAGGGGDMNIGQLVTSLPSEETGLHAVIPLSWCPHLESDVNPLPDGGLDARSSCRECGDTRENWVCLHCYQVFCGRYINEHMVLHGVTSMHHMVLSFSDLSVWCYGCDSYVHNELLIPAKTSGHVSKFGEDIPGV